MDELVVSWHVQRVAQTIHTVYYISLRASTERKESSDEYETASDESESDDSDGGVVAENDRRYPLRTRTQREIPGAVRFNPNSSSSSTDDGEGNRWSGIIRYCVTTWYETNSWSLKFAISEAVDEDLATIRGSVANAFGLLKMRGPLISTTQATPLPTSLMGWLDFISALFLGVSLRYRAKSLHSALVRPIIITTTTVCHYHHYNYQHHHYH